MNQATGFAGSRLSYLAVLLTAYCFASDTTSLLSVTGIGIK